MNKCPDCGDYIFSYSTNPFIDRHKCKPQFYVWFTDYDFDDVYEVGYNRVYAADAEQAAIKFAEKDWEFPDSIDVYVIDVKTLNKIMDEHLEDASEFTDEVLKKIIESSKKFTLESEVVRNFYATESNEKV